MPYALVENLLDLESILYGLVLVPGFEPGSTDRESVMMDRTTLHELAIRSASQKFIKSTLINLDLSLSLSLRPLIQPFIC